MGNCASKKAQPRDDHGFGNADETCTVLKNPLDLKCGITAYNGRTSVRENVSCVRGDLAEQEVDIIVCYVNDTLQLSKGHLSKKILRTGGKEIQEEIRTKYPNGLEHGQVAVVNAGNLRCQKLYFVPLPTFDNNICVTEAMKPILSACLAKADEGNFKSIAVPALGPKQLKHQVNDFVDAIHASWREFRARSPKSAIELVIVVCGPKEKELCKVFEATNLRYDSSYENQQLCKDACLSNSPKMDSLIDPVEEGDNAARDRIKDKDNSSQSFSCQSCDRTELMSNSDNNDGVVRDLNVHCSTSVDSHATSHLQLIELKMESTRYPAEGENVNDYSSHQKRGTSEPTIGPLSDRSGKVINNPTEQNTSSSDIDFQELLDGSTDSTFSGRKMIEETCAPGSRYVPSEWVDKVDEPSSDFDKCEETQPKAFETIPTQLIQPLSLKSICEYIKTNGAKSKTVLGYVKWLCNYLEQNMFGDCVKTLFPGYEYSKPYEPVFVAILEETAQKVSCSSSDFRIIQRNYGEVSDEAKAMFDKEKETQNKFTKDEADRLQRCILKHTKTLLQKHSNLLIIRASKVRKCKHNKTIKQEPCIVLYVHVKGIIPFGEDLFPNTLDGFPVDVLEGIFRFGVSPKDYLRSLMMGCYFETAHQTAGTLGGFVSLEDGSIGCLTACHIFKPHIDNVDFVRNAYQPNNKPHYKFGEVVKHSFGETYDNEITVDAVLIKITEEGRYPISGRFPDAESPHTGFSPQDPMIYRSGNIVNSFEEIPFGCNAVKYGAASEHTIGYLNPVSVAVRGFDLIDESVTLRGQLEVQPLRDPGVFATEGDSGALVFALRDSANTDDRIRALGLYIGSCSAGPAIVTPIWAILRKLNLPSQLMSFFNPLKDSMGYSDRLLHVEEELKNLQESHRRLEEYARREMENNRREMENNRQTIAGIKTSNQVARVSPVGYRLDRTSPSGDAGHSRAYQFRFHSCSTKNESDAEASKPVLRVKPHLDEQAGPLLQLKVPKPLHDTDLKPCT